MRELKVIGLDVDGKAIICEGRDPSDKFLIPVDDRLRAAVRGDRSLGQTLRDIEVKGVLRPKDIQARIRAGASVEQLAESSGMDISKIERFAHPVLLERQRAAELATAAHPVLADGPAVVTLLEAISAWLAGRGLSSEATSWDAWRNEDGRWTVQMAWQAGLSDNVAHFRFSPGAHGGTVTAIDDAANELIDPNFERTLRPVAPVAQLEFEEPAAPKQAPAPASAPAPVEEEPAPAVRAKRGKAKPTVPAWEDVLLGVRSSGDR
ncbi:MAG: septation protein SepH [Micropruina sp.]